MTAATESGQGRPGLRRMAWLLRGDLSAWSLLLANLFAIVLALAERWSLVEIMAVWLPAGLPSLHRKSSSPHPPRSGHLLPGGEGTPKCSLAFPG